MHLNTFLQDIVDNLKEVEGLQAIVLGGSRASDTQRPDSDIDLGLYYNDVSPLDIDHIRRICIELNDTPDPVVTNIGEWGKWVNGGAWLTIQEQQVDFLYRNIDFVSKILDDCNRGETQFDYLQQPPHGFYSYIYCAETHICKILYDPIGAIQKLKSKFSLYIAKKSANRGEVYAVTGSLTRIASNLVQVLYALNETYFISDKRVYKDMERFSLKPQNFVERIDCILGEPGCDSKKLEGSILMTSILLYEVTAFCRDQYIPKFKLR